MQLMVRSFGLGVLALACICVSGCDQREPETPDPGNPSGEVRVSPGDRLGWLQQAADAAEVASFQFALYVDGTRTTLAGVSCTPAAGGAFDCSGAVRTIAVVLPRNQTSTSIRPKKLELQRRRRSPQAVPADRQRALIGDRNPARHSPRPQTFD